MRRHSIDPRFSQFHLDTCAFDPKYSPEDESARELWSLHEREVVNLVLAHSTQREIDHPNTPIWVKRQARGMIYTLPVQLTAEERRRRQAVETLLQGNATPGKHTDDSHHIFEASKYGAHFVTTDGRILRVAADLLALCGVVVLLPSDVIDRVDLSYLD